MLIRLLTVRLPVHRAVTSKTTQFHRHIQMDFLEGWLRYGGPRLPIGTSYYISLRHIDLNLGSKCPLSFAGHTICSALDPGHSP
jgi:hypothetical protein